ncbi:beta strand repeat-containing protein [Flavobacterium sp. KACC 22763]|uniref:beta strand repeat-containing protein n=1 Tax=Flavobacterium sp. KACC 22763 TaxID=3025668 RepID=UPI0023670413|nr:DUF5977 domain-containing protein [Flavobacterium sp. KACC 22763]WDF66485.1 DUF5977 domain-containing protein [Flavobacterium sp. KACC 22763]
MKKHLLLLAFIIFNSMVLRAQDCPAIVGSIKGSSPSYPAICEANVIATPSTQSIFSGEATSISLTTSKIGTVFSWTVVQTGVTGASSGSGASIAQTLANIGGADGTAIYTVTPKLGNCSGTPINITITVKSLYKNLVASGTFTKNNCGAGGTGSTVTYTVNAGTYSASTQAEADTLAQNDVNANGQTYANTNGTCTFVNVAKSGTYTKNNCGTGGTGSSVTYTVAAGTYRASTQAAADTLAQNDVNANGQTYANNNGTCTFKNVAKSGTYTKNNCGAGGTGSSVTYTVAAGTYSASTQAAADTLAQNDVNANGQTYANNNGTCTFKNVVKSGTYTKNNCGAGGTGSSVTYTVAAGTYSASTQAAADTLAQNDVNANGQTYANTNGTCTFVNVAKSGTYTKNNCGTGGTGSSVTYTVAAGTYSASTQAAADTLAQNDVNANGQTYANTNGTCTFVNVVKSGTYTKNNCGAGGTGSSVTYTVAAGTYSASTQAAADTLAQNDVNANGQTYANTNGTCTFVNVAKSGTYTKNNCGTGGTGSSVTYTVAAGTYSASTQAAADTLAQNDVNANGQTYANNNGTCTFKNVAKSGTYTKNNCGAGGTGSSVTYTVAAGTYSASTQAAADTLAQNDVNANGQTYANNNGTCTFKNVAKSGTYTKNNCGAGGTGSSVTYTVAAGTYSASTQAAADTLAQNDVNANGQTYANNNGTCTFKNVAKSGTYTKNNCGAGGTGSSVTYTVAAGTYSASTQAAADTLAQNDVNANGQTYANNNGTCTFVNVAKSGTYTKNNCGTGGTGSSVTYTVAAGTYSASTQAAADTLAQNDVNANGQTYANNNGTCTFKNVAKSGTYTKNNCGAGGTGSSVTYTVAAGTYSASTQAAADTLAQNDVNANGQTYANNNGTCTFKNVAKSGTYTKNNCGAGGTGSSVTYTVAAGTYSASTQAAADTLAQNDVNANGQTYANNNGTCTFVNVAKSGTYTKNNCGTGGTGSSVTYTVAAGTYSASTQAAADTLAQNDVNANGQTYANTNGTCTFVNVAKSGTYTKNNCGTGGTGSSVTYTVAAGTYSASTQAAADTLAQNDVNANGQTYANTNGTCTFVNVAKSGTYTKNNCGAGGTGSSVTYTVAAGTYSASTQAAADTLAQNDVNANGQTYANTNGTCTFVNVAKSGTYTKNNCGAGGTGSSVTYTVAAGTYSASTQAAADTLAQNDVNANGQTYANNNGTCTFKNVAKSGTYTKNNCGAGGTGSSVTYTVAAGTYSASTQAAADTLAQNDVNANGQTYANNNGTCTFKNVAKSGTYTKNNCGTGGTGSSVTYTVAAGTYSASTQAAADTLAQNDVNANGQTYANNNGTCTFVNVAKSGTYTKNNCGTGGTGSSVTYTVAAGTYSASTQAAADTLAQNDINANGQTYANTNGTCTFVNVAKSGTFTKNNCGTGGTGSSVTYTVAAGTYSASTQAAADTLAQNDVNANGQTYANTNGTCTFVNVAKSGTYTKNNCGAGGTGSSVTYTVAAGTYSASTQAAADTLAQNDVNANGQTYANNNGTCTFVNVAKSGTFTRNNCNAFGTGSTVTYTIPAGTYSASTQAAADTLAQNAVNANGQTYANSNGTCTYPSYYTFRLSSPGRTSATTACTQTNFTFIVYSDSPYFGIGQQLYLNTQLTTKVGSGNTWHQDLESGQAILINNSGQISQIQQCPNSH